MPAVMTPATDSPASAPEDADAAVRSRLIARFREVRAFTEALARPLAVEDYVVQSMPDVSPTKWHLAHVSWFFETFVLQPYVPSYRSIDARYAFLFNSYYVQAGERHCRDRRGYISRPTVSEVYAYRAHVDEHMNALMVSADDETWARIAPLVEIGINHEQQHQELLLTDVKHVLSVNPLRPVYAEAPAPPDRAEPMMDWVYFDEGLYEVGHAGPSFAYDNEAPRHRVFLDGYLLATRPVTCGEFIAFMADDGYRRPELWLSMGWALVQERNWSEPFYWERRDDAWYHFTLSGMQKVNPAEPICHVSYFEADAFARWAAARLPTEEEWETAASPPIHGNFVEDGHRHPVTADDTADQILLQMYGDVWEWTRSQYSPYPGYRPAPGAIGEYNGKFMCNQFVLRGGSCATSRTHIRPTYRNFFPPEATWQFSGFRLARDV